MLIAYPSTGNSFVALTWPSSAGALGGGRVMNSKGVVLMMTGGQAAQPGDSAAGYPQMVADFYAMWKSNSATQAKNTLLSLHPNGGLVLHLADTSGHAYVIEETSTANAVRTSGELGEHDYLLGANMFLTKTMRPHNYRNQLETGQIDDWYRYYTEQKLLNQEWGKLTASSLMQILGYHAYYGTRNPVTGAVDTSKPQKWHRNVWSLTPASDPQSEWTPGWTCSGTDSREIYLPGEKTLYEMVGGDITALAEDPNPTGEFSKVVLADSPADVAQAGQDAARLQLWYAARHLHFIHAPAGTHKTELDKGKQDFWQGMNLQDQAALTADPNQQLALYGQATTCFCQAQCYFEQAQDLNSDSSAPPNGYRNGG